MISKKRLKKAAIPLRKLRVRIQKQRSLSTIRKPTYTHCKNCGKQLTEMYCPRCGQYALVTHQTLKQTVVSYFENNYSFDKNLLQSLIYLFFKPGFLAKEYMNGKTQFHIHLAVTWDQLVLHFVCSHWIVFIYLWSTILRLLIIVALHQA